MQSAIERKRAQNFFQVRVCFCESDVRKDIDYKIERSWFKMI